MASPKRRREPFCRFAHDFEVADDCVPSLAIGEKLLDRVAVNVLSGLFECVLDIFEIVFVATSIR